MQYQYSSFHVHTRLNKLDMEIIEHLMQVSIDSHYEIVRQEARTDLFHTIAQYPYSILTLVPKLVQVLSRATNEAKDGLEKEQLEGCLHLLLGSGVKASLLIYQDWKVIAKIWPKLYTCKYFDEETIKKILELIHNSTNQNFESFDNFTLLSASVISSANKLNPSSDSRKETRLARMEEKREQEKQLLAKLIRDLCEIARDPRTIWKNQEISLFSLIYLFNPCQKYPELLTHSCVKLFTSALIHENPNFRRVFIKNLIFHNFQLKILEKT